MLALMRKHLLKWSMPVMKRIGMMHLPYTKKKIKARHYRDFIEVLMPGMVLTATTYGEASNLLIPGEMKHGAIYVGDGMVVEALGHGVVETDLIDFMLSKDHIKLYTPQFCEPEQGVLAAQWARSQIGTPYDYEFQSNNKALYCFELTFAAYQEALEGKSPWVLYETMGEPTVVGDDFERAANKWKLIRDSRQTS